MIPASQPLTRSALERTLAAIRRDLFILKCEVAATSVCLLVLLIFG